MRGLATWSPGHRPAQGGGLAVLVVVTVLAALAAPHAKAVRGRLAGGLPAMTAPKRPAPPPTTRPKGLTFSNGAGCRPAGDFASSRLDRRVRTLLVAVSVQYRIRVSCLRTGHSWFVNGTRRVSNHSVWRAVDVDQVDGRPVSRSNTAARRLALWIGRGQAGVQPSEVGSPWTFGTGSWFSDAGHQGHLHVGFPGPTQVGAR
jgi:hypothetical protein